MIRPEHATLAQVAKKAGVGTTTVSRVINGGQNVDPGTLARVQAAIRVLGYQPNQAARILKGARTRTIGLIIPSIVDPFFASCAEAVQVVVREHDSVLIVLTTQNDPKTELDAIHVLLRHRVDGLIIASCNVEDKVLTAMLGQLSTPIVTLDRPIVGSTIPVVLADNCGGARIATEHLIEHGYRRITCLTTDTHLYTIRERMRGYRQAMRAAGLERHIETVTGHASVAACVQTCIQELLIQHDGPQAIFTLKNSLTVSAFESLQRLGVAMPAAVALLGYDDFQLADLLRPSISVIMQPIAEIGRVAAELLCDRLLHLSGDGPGGRRRAVGQERVQLPTHLIRRESCGCREPA